MSSIKELLNKGVPISTPVLIRSSDLIKNSNNKEETLEKIRTEFAKYLFGLKVFGYDEFEVFMNFSETFRGCLLTAPFSMLYCARICGYSGDPGGPEYQLTGRCRNRNRNRNRCLPDCNPY